MTGASPQITLFDSTAGEDDFWIHVNSNNFYVLADRDDSGAFEGPHPLQIEADTSIGYLFGSQILSAAEIDTCAEFIAFVVSTGTCGSAVFSVSPTFTGTAAFASLTSSGTANFNGSTPYVFFDDSDGGDTWQVGSGGGTLLLFNTTDAQTGLSIDGTQDVTIPSGDLSVSVGTLDVGRSSLSYGNSTGIALFNSGAAYMERASGGGVLFLNRQSDSGVVLQIQDQSAVCTIDPAIGGLSTSCSSDARLKSGIRDFEGSALQYFSDFYIRNYEAIAEGEGGPTHTGLIAQEILLTHPELVTIGESGYYMVAEPSPYIMVKAIQELDLNLQALVASSTASSTPQTEEFAQAFWSGAFARITAWLADAGNGIADLFVEAVHAEVVYTRKVQTDELCVGSVCVTEAEFLRMVEQSGGTSSGSEEPSPDQSNTPETGEPASSTPPESESPPPPSEDSEAEVAPEEVPTQEEPASNSESIAEPETGSEQTPAAETTPEPPPAEESPAEEAPAPESTPEPDPVEGE
ncbi:tail fiber domain-containing protein [Candidatus Parcubacteria bacterium]|nr:MAG: tail fiber domain-containing protein [Candidatus Parcubacteria bacterium]